MSADDPRNQTLCPFCNQPKGAWIPTFKYKEHQFYVHDIGKNPDPNAAFLVQFYSEHTRALLKPQQLKVLKFLEHNCIVYEGGSTYICKSIPKYNKTAYKIKKDEAGILTCSCQYNTTKGEICSHIGALYEFWARAAKIRA